MITICVMSDLHGRADRLQAYAKEMKELRPDIILDNGDFWQGSLSSFYYDFIAKKPNPMFEVANEIGVDALIIGNHEFNEPVINMKQRQAQCNFPWISCNLGDFAKPYIIKEVKGKRVGVIGATTQMAPLWDERGFSDGILFEAAAPAVEKYVKLLREVEQVDYVVVSYHGGFSENVGHMWPFTASPIENEANALLTLAGIDVLITGHQHLQVCSKIGETVVVQPGANGECYAKITIGEKVNAELVPIVAETYYEADIAKWLQTKIGETADDFRFKGLLASRMKSHPFVDFVHEVQLSYAKTDLSIVDLLYYEEGGFIGEVKNSDVLNVLSRPNVLQKVWLTGQEVKQFLEQIAATFEINGAGQIDFSYHVLTEGSPPYLYFYVGGLDYKMMIDMPVGERVVKCSVKGEPLQLDRLYSVCLNSYLATGADFPVFREKEKITICEEMIPLLVLRYIREHSPLLYRQVSRFEVTQSSE